MIKISKFESLQISGPSRVLSDSVFSFIVDVKRVSRASYGYFSTVMSIIEKRSGDVIKKNQRTLHPGKNIITYSDMDFIGPDKVYMTPHFQHIFRIQYMDKTWEHEFLPFSVSRDNLQIIFQQLWKIKENNFLDHVINLLDNPEKPKISKKIISKTLQQAQEFKTILEDYI